eukprot:Nk52_evm3s642 gene=Nk52_evmTU3s642
MMLSNTGSALCSSRGIGAGARKLLCRQNQDAMLANVAKRFVSGEVIAEVMRGKIEMSGMKKENRINLLTPRKAKNTPENLRKAWHQGRKDPKKERAARLMYQEYEVMDLNKKGRHEWVNSPYLDILKNSMEYYDLPGTFEDNVLVTANFQASFPKKNLTKLQKLGETELKILSVVFDPPVDVTMDRMEALKTMTKKKPLPFECELFDGTFLYTKDAEVPETLKLSGKCFKEKKSINAFVEYRKTVKAKDTQKHLSLYNLCGAVLEPKECVEAPILTINPYDNKKKGRFLTFVMFALDGMFPSSLEVFPHWCIANVPILDSGKTMVIGGSGATIKGSEYETIMPYVQPLPIEGGGDHRYCIYMYAHEGKLDINREKLLKSCTEQYPLSDLPMVGVQHFQASFDSSVPEAFKKFWGVDMPAVNVEFQNPMEEDIV